MVHYDTWLKSLPRISLSKCFKSLSLSIREGYSILSFVFILLFMNISYIFMGLSRKVFNIERKIKI